MKLDSINQAEIARALGVSRSAVNQWFSKEGSVPAERCPAIEKITGGAITCEQMRPDVPWEVLRANPQNQHPAHA